MLSNKEKKVLKRQLNSIQGQVKAIDKMIDQNRNSEDIYIQFKAVEGIVDKAIYGILDDLFRKNFAEALVKAVEACPGECDDCEKLEIVKKQFGTMELKEVFKHLTRLNQVQKND